MLVKNIWPALKELTGTCDDEVNYQALALGLDWLANKALFDPFVGYLDFYVDQSYKIALPREVKAPIRININNNPSFARSRLFEFTMNTDGSNDGERIGWEWQNQGFTCVQDERRLPAQLCYVCSDLSDEGASATLVVKDTQDRTQTVTLIAAQNGATPSTVVIKSVESVVRAKTAGECFLRTSDALLTVARYYPDEEQPDYRVIKLSKTGVAVRMMFRRHAPQEFTSQSDIIPFHSRLAIIHAAKTVRYLQKSDYANAASSAAAAISFAKDEQDSRDESMSLSEKMDVATVRNARIGTLDVLVVSDIYDEAAELFGGIGRDKLFDRITVARQLLGAKANWDWTVGSVDIWKADTTLVDGPLGRGTGIFTLPRYVGAVLAVAPSGIPTIPQNRWFEYHLNGPGETRAASVGHWEDMGEACTANEIPCDPDSKRPVPHKLVCIPGTSLDMDVKVRIYGLELNSFGREIEVERGGVMGWECPIVPGATAAAADSPDFTRITDIVKGSTKGFVTLVGYRADDGTRDVLLGQYYPEDTRPRFRRIKVANLKADRIRVLYKLRECRINSLYDLLHLRTSAAIIEMMRAMSIRKTDQQAADAAESTAIRYLSEMERSDNPTETLKLQFNSRTMPGGFRNIT